MVVPARTTASLRFGVERSVTAMDDLRASGFRMLACMEEVE